jgi:hypothetical protein
MKIEIRYKFEGATHYPFKAVAWFDDTCIVGMSEFSFDEAKQDLLKDIKIAIERAPIVIPEMEVIEL